MNNFIYFRGRVNKGLASGIIPGLSPEEGYSRTVNITMSVEQRTPMLKVLGLV